MNNAALRTEIVRLYVEDGLTAAEIGDRVGRHKATVQYYLKTSNVQARKQRIDWPVEQMRKWYEVDGLTFQQIAQRLGEDARQVGKCARRNGFQTRRTGPKSGNEHTGWKGGRHVEKQGYVSVYCPEHPFATKHTKHVREHRLVMEERIGRYLQPHEVVHHVNGNPQDNRIENLVLFESNAAHLSETLQGKCPRWTEDGIRRIAEGFAKQHRRSAKKVAESLRQRAYGSQETTGRLTTPPDKDCPSPCKTASAPVQQLSLPYQD